MKILVIAIAMLISLPVWASDHYEAESGREWVMSSVEQIEGYTVHIDSVRRLSKEEWALALKSIKLAVMSYSDAYVCKFKDIYFRIVQNGGELNNYDYFPDECYDCYVYPKSNTIMNFRVYHNVIYIIPPTKDYYFTKYANLSILEIFKKSCKR